MKMSTAATAATPVPPAPLRILIADDHSAMRLGIAAIVSMIPGGQKVGEAVNGEQAVEAYCALRPDVMTLDLRMPALDGLEVIQRVITVDPAAKILVMTMYDHEDDVVRSLRAGARGYVLKSAPADEIEQAILNVAKGLRYTPSYVAAQLAAHLSSNVLTPRETDVLVQIRTGASNKVIGRQLGLTEGTVKSHVRGIMAKLNVSSRSEAVDIALKRGLLK
jgi:DNA-binding NarL/FixJ family response regulator